MHYCLIRFLIIALINSAFGALLITHAHNTSGVYVFHIYVIMYLLCGIVVEAYCELHHKNMYYPIYSIVGGTLPFILSMYSKKMTS